MDSKGLFITGVFCCGMARLSFIRFGLFCMFRFCLEKRYTGICPSQDMVDDVGGHCCLFYHDTLQDGDAYINSYMLDMPCKVKL